MFGNLTLAHLLFAAAFWRLSMPDCYKFRNVSGNRNLLRLTWKSPLWKKKIIKGRSAYRREQHLSALLWSWCLVSSGWELFFLSNNSSYFCLVMFLIYLQGGKKELALSYFVSLFGNLLYIHIYTAGVSNPWSGYPSKVIWNWVAEV